MAVVPNARAGLEAATRATVIQLRAPDMSARELEREARDLTAASPVPVLVSGRCDVALATLAAGVNLPERDISVADARSLMGDRIVGRSVHSLEAALAAEQEGASYVIFGPVFESTSHPGATPVGLQALGEVARALRIPVVAIGGIDEDRVAQVHAAGASGFAAIGMFA